MTAYYVVDAHLHTYKTPEIGLQALSGWDLAGCVGTPEELLGIMDQAGIASAVQVNLTPARVMYDAAMAGLVPEADPDRAEAVRLKIADRIRRRNEWTCRVSREHPRLVPYISVDPLMGSAGMVDELVDKVRNHGARGLKIHPSEGRYSPDSADFQPVWETAERLGIPVTTHGGEYELDQSGDVQTRPRAFARILAEFPRLTLQIGHLGRGFFDESIELAGRFPNVCFDTSTVIPAGGDGVFSDRDGGGLSDEEAADLFRRVGVERVMFGTDYPWLHPAWELKRLLGLPLSEEEKKAVLGENARRILNL
ncbi:MAG: amidohydrolase family protein [Proteobacteria bacterium]|nr:amidohydrolase family protein [Pseudomonadota bacterium]